MNNLVYLLSYIFSRSPLFSITLDERFHEISNKNYDNNKLRTSFFSFGLGVRKLYFLTYKKGEGFRFFKVIKLEDIQAIPNNEMIENKSKEYLNHIKSKEAQDVEVEKEFIQYRISQEENKKNIALSKINNYIAITSILVPILASNVIQAYSQISSKYKIILLAVTGYTLINVILYILAFLKVKGFTRSTFADVKNSNEHKNKIVQSFYADWYSMKEESTIYVTFVTNVERYLKLVIASTLCILFLGNFSGIYKKTVNSSDIDLKSTNCIVNISLKNGQVAQEDLNKLTHIYEELSSSNVKELIIVKNSLDDDNVREKYDTIYNSLKMYNVNKINLNVISEDDINIKEPSLKIISIGGKK